MDICKLETELKAKIEDKKGKVISINGDWGVGKTYFWHDFMKGTSTFEYVHISLYGKESITSIKEEIASSLSMLQDVISKIDKNSGLVGEYFPIIKLFKDSKVNNVIISFDDFERMSDKINVKDFLGLISDLKDNNKCRIVLILNELKVKSEDFSLGKEKVIDYEYLFNPDVEKALEYSEIKSLKFFNPDIIKKYAVKYSINNIRVLRKIIFSLKNLEEYLSKYKDESYFYILVANIMKKVLPLLYIYYKFNFYRFNELEEYSAKKSRKFDFEEKEEFEKYLFYFYTKRFPRSQFNDLIKDYIRYGYFNEELIGIIINIEIEKANKNNIYNEYKELRKDLFYNFKTDFSSSSSSIRTFLEKNKEFIAISFKDLDEFYLEIKELCKIDCSNEMFYNRYLKDSINYYLNYFEKNQPGYFFNSSFLSTIEKIEEKDVDISEIIKRVVKEDVNTITSLINKIFNMYFVNIDTYEKC